MAGIAREKLALGGELESMAWTLWLNIETLLGGTLMEGRKWFDSLTSDPLYGDLDGREKREVVSLLHVVKKHYNDLWVAIQDNDVATNRSGLIDREACNTWIDRRLTGLAQDGETAVPQNDIVPSRDSDLTKLQKLWDNNRYRRKRDSEEWLAGKQIDGEVLTRKRAREILDSLSGVPWQRRPARRKRKTNAS